MHGGEERFAVFGVSCCDAPPSFEHQKCVLNQMPQFIKLFIICSLYDAIFLGWNDGVHALSGGLRKDRIGIISLIREKMFGLDPLDQL